MLRCLLPLLLACVLAAAALPAQEEPTAAEGTEPSAEGVPEDATPLPPEPASPREELFLAIELRDVEAARRALRAGADAEISLGDPSPLATAALHDDLRMVSLLLDFGGDPSATRDSPLEEAIRNENGRMVQLLMRAGARVPSGDRGEELFRLAQRGPAASELSQILLDHGADPDQCLAAATGREDTDLVRYCLERGADIAALPAERNVLAVALRRGDGELVDLLVDGGLADGVLAGALVDAVAAGDMDLVRLAVARGVAPGYQHVEAAIENGRLEICTFLLEQSPPEDPAMLEGGDAAALILRAEDLGLDEIAAALRRKSGLPRWPLAGVLLPVLGGGLLLAVLAALAVRRLRRPTGAVVAVPAELVPGAPRRPAPPPAPPPAARPPVPPAAAPAPPPPGPPAAPAPAAPAPPAAGDPGPAATRPLFVPPPAEAPPPESPSAVWEIAPEPEGEAEVPSPVPAVAISGAGTAVETRMPEVDLSHDAAAVFRAARRAAAGEAGEERRQIVLVTPARVTMLRPCPAPGDVDPQALAAAEQVAPRGTPRQVAAIAYNEIDAVRGDIATAIPFFDLLKHLGALGHAVWIFEGHVSAMAEGCRDADVLIVDDGMMRHLPGNWRSVASRVMRGGAIFVFERKTGALRRL